MPVAQNADAPHVPSCDVFLSYAQADLRDDKQQRVRVIYNQLRDRGWSVFWDATLQPGLEWRPAIEGYLAGARCVLTLWDQHAVRSEEVRYEAGRALQAGKLLQARLAAVQVPDPFAKDQWAKLETWDGTPGNFELSKLMSAVEGRVLPQTYAVTLPDPANGAVTSVNLQLVHSCHRRPDQDARFPGRRMYRIQVMLIGHANALARVKSVTYRLDGAYEGRSPRVSSARAGNFGFSELANGYSVVNADVEVAGQDARVVLSRFINLMDHGPDLLGQFAPDFKPDRA
jgi:TIR domain